MSDQYRKQFQAFLAHLESEMEIFMDKDLEQEVKTPEKMNWLWRLTIFMSNENIFFQINNVQKN